MRCHELIVVAVAVLAGSARADDRLDKLATAIDRRQAARQAWIGQSRGDHGGLVGAQH